MLPLAAKWCFTKLLKYRPAIQLCLLPLIVAILVDVRHDGDSDGDAVSSAMFGLLSMVMAMAMAILFSTARCFIDGRISF